MHMFHKNKILNSLLLLGTMSAFPSLMVAADPLANDTLADTLTQSPETFWTHIAIDRPHFNVVSAEDLQNFQIIAKRSPVQASELYPPRLTWGHKILAATGAELDMNLFGTTRKCFIFIPKDISLVWLNLLPFVVNASPLEVSEEVKIFTRNTPKDLFYNRLKQYYNAEKDALTNILLDLFNKHGFLFQSSADDSDDVDALQHIFIPFPTLLTQADERNLATMPAPFPNLSGLADIDQQNLGLRLSFTNEGSFFILRQVSVESVPPQAESKPLFELLHFPSADAGIGREAIFDDIILSLLNQSFATLSAYFFSFWTKSHPQKKPTAESTPNSEQAFYATSLFTRSFVVPFYRSVSGWKTDFNYRIEWSRIYFPEAVYENILDSKFFWYKTPNIFSEGLSVTYEFFGYRGPSVVGTQLNLAEKKTKPITSTIMDLAINNCTTTYDAAGDKPYFPPLAPECIFFPQYKHQIYKSPDKSFSNSSNKFQYFIKDATGTHPTIETTLKEIIRQRMPLTMSCFCNKCWYPVNTSPLGSDLMALDLAKHTLDNHQALMTTAYRFIKDHQNAKQANAVFQLNQLTAANSMWPWLENCRKLAVNSKKPFVRITSFFADQNPLSKTKKKSSASQENSALTAAKFTLQNLLKPDSVNNVRLLSQYGPRSVYEITTKQPFFFAFYQRENFLFAAPYERSFVGDTNQSIFIVESKGPHLEGVTLYPVKSPQTKVLVDLLAEAPSEKH